MKGYVYAIIVAYIAVGIELALSFRGEYGQSVIAGVLAVLGCCLIIGYLCDDRQYYRKFKLHSITLWGKDLK